MAGLQCPSPVQFGAGRLLGDEGPFLRGVPSGWQPPSQTRPCSIIVPPLI
jgi:hypothetical protein